MARVDGNGNKPNNLGGGQGDWVRARGWRRTSENRPYPSDEKIDVGYNGYANLSFNGPSLQVACFDLNQSRLKTEDWHVDIESGALDGPDLKRVLDDP